MKKNSDLLFLFMEGEEEDALSELSKEDKKDSTNKESSEDDTKDKDDSDTSNNADNKDVEEKDNTDTENSDSREENNNEEEQINKDKENKKRLIFFKHFSSLFSLVTDFKEKIEQINKEDEKNLKLLEFIKEKNNILLDNINYILKEKIEFLDITILSSLFSSFKSEINLLLELSEKILKTDVSNEKDKH